MTRAAIGRTLAGVAWVLSLVACTKETTPPSREAEGRATTGSVSAPLASVHAAPSAAATGAADPARLEAGDPARGKTLDTRIGGRKEGYIGSGTGVKNRGWEEKTERKKNKEKEKYKREKGEEK